MKENNIKKLFTIYPILENIDNKENQVISQSIIFRRLDALEQLSAYADNCPGFLFVIDGKINIKRINENGEETHLYDLRKGELCHEALSCFLKCDPLKIIGTAIQDSNIAIIPFDIVRKYLLKDSGFYQYIYVDLYSKLNKIINKKEEVKHEPIEKRLLKFLIQKDNKIIYVTHSEIAFELDTAREVISRKLKDFENKGYISSSRGKIHLIKDLKELLK